MTKISKCMTFNTTAILPRIGRSSILSPRNTSKITNEGKTNPHITSRELQRSLAESGVNLHVYIIRGTLNWHSNHWGDVKRKSLLPTENKVTYLNFARVHLEKLEAFWKSILWIDESKRELFGDNQNCHVMRRKSTVPTKTRTSFQQWSIVV